MFLEDDFHKALNTPGLLNKYFTFYDRSFLNAYFRMKAIEIDQARQRTISQVIVDEIDNDTFTLIDLILAKQKRQQYYRAAFRNAIDNASIYTNMCEASWQLNKLISALKHKAYNDGLKCDLSTWQKIKTQFKQRSNP